MLSLALAPLFNFGCSSHLLYMLSLALELLFNFGCKSHLLYMLSLALALALLFNFECSSHLLCMLSLALALALLFNFGCSSHLLYMLSLALAFALLFKFGCSSHLLNMLSLALLLLHKFLRKASYYEVIRHGAIIIWKRHNFKFTVVGQRGHYINIDRNLLNLADIIVANDNILHARSRIRLVFAENNLVYCSCSVEIVESSGVKLTVVRNRSQKINFCRNFFKFTDANSKITDK